MDTSLRELKTNIPLPTGPTMRPFNSFAFTAKSKEMLEQNFVSKKWPCNAEAELVEALLIKRFQSSLNVKLG